MFRNINWMNGFKRTIAVIIYSIPVDIMIIGCIIKGISFTDAGLFSCGLVFALVGGLYAWFVAKPEHKMPMAVMVSGMVLCLCSMVAVILGMVAMATPITYIGGTKVWKSCKLKGLE